MDRIDIPTSIVYDLIKQQFPQWADLPIKPVESSGWDNYTFHLSEEMLIRFPSAERYASQVQKEQHWLQKLAPHLSFQIPEPLAMGKPSRNYPYNWSIYRWIEGEVPNELSDENKNLFASDLAQFLIELQRTDTTDAPLPGKHNFYRGASPDVYDTEIRSAIKQLKNYIDVKTVTGIWERAIRTRWQNEPVWIHGDMSTDNLLLKEDRLTAVIDFGGLGIGDPACDLVIAWTFFEPESRDVFKKRLGLDSDTWDRARGWALWKALIVIADCEDKTCPLALKRFGEIQEIVGEYNQKPVGMIT